MYFEYGTQELEYLKGKDPVLGKVIDCLGFIRRETEPDLFSAVVHQIVGQQISMAAQRTIWERMIQGLGSITAQTVVEADKEELKGYGISYRKADYIQSFAKKVLAKELNLEELWALSDEEVIKRLTALKGIGVWTAEMILLFGMKRPDVVSFGDFGIRHGMCLLYGEEELTKEKFEHYRTRYSPWGSVASLYLWAVAGGACPMAEER